LPRVERPLDPKTNQGCCLFASKDSEVATV
jgi:hypothetical protein